MRAKCALWAEKVWARSIVSTRALVPNSAFTEVFNREYYTTKSVSSSSRGKHSRENEQYL